MLPSIETKASGIRSLAYRRLTRETHDLRVLCIVILTSVGDLLQASTLTEPS